MTIISVLSSSRCQRHIGRCFTICAISAASTGCLTGLANDEEATMNSGPEGNNSLNEDAVEGTIVEDRTPGHMNEEADLQHTHPANLLDHYYVTNFQYRGFYVDYNKVIQTQDGYGPQTFDMSITQEFGVEWSGNAGVDASSINAGLGFSIDEKQTVSGGTMMTVPEGKYGSIEAFPHYALYTWEIWSDGGWGSTSCIHVADGWAHRPSGIHFRTTLTP